MKIAITGWAGAGKTKMAEYLKDKYGGEILSFASEIKRIDRRLFGLGSKDRKRLQKIGESMREIDPNVWINIVKNDIDLIIDYEENSNVYIDDLRRENEYKMLKDINFQFVRVVADEDIRIQRLIERDGECDVSLMYNESEKGCSYLNLFEIDNNGTLDDFYKQIDEYVEKIRMGD